MRWAGHAVRMGEKRLVYRFFLSWGNLRLKKLLGRPRRRWKGDIKIDLQEV